MDFFSLSLALSLSFTLSRARARARARSLSVSLSLSRTRGAWNAARTCVCIGKPGDRLDKEEPETVLKPCRINLVKMIYFHTHTHTHTHTSTYVHIYWLAFAAALSVFILKITQTHTPLQQLCRPPQPWPHFVDIISYYY